MENNVTSKQLKISLPANVFKNEFIDIYVKKGLGVKAWQVPEFFKLNKVNEDIYETFQALDDTPFICKKVNDDIQFLGTY